MSVNGVNISQIKSGETGHKFGGWKVERERKREQTREINMEEVEGRRETREEAYARRNKNGGKYRKKKKKEKNERRGREMEERRIKRDWVREEERMIPKPSGVPCHREK